MNLTLSHARASGALLLGAALLAACSKPAPPPPPLAKVAWLTAAPAAAAKRSFTGVVHARTESSLAFRVGGKVTAKLVEAGDAVRKGQPLLRLDASDYVLAANAARAAVAAAQARLTQADADEQRLRRLAGTGAVSTQAYEQAKAAADSARAQLEADQARARQADHQGDYAVLLADMDGVVMEVAAEPGQVVAQGQTVVRLAGHGPREALVYLPETMRALARRPASAFRYGAGAATAASATLRELSALAEPQTRSYPARFILGGAAARSPLGATVTVQLQGDADAAITVPVSALVDQGGGPGVWVIDGNATVSLRPVRIAALGEEQARLAQGLRAGERIVAFGGHLLQAGQKVALQSPPAPAVPPATEPRS